MHAASSVRASSMCKERGARCIRVRCRALGVRSQTKLPVRPRLLRFAVALAALPRHPRLGTYCTAP